MSEATEEDILSAALAAAARVQVISGVPDSDEVAALVAGLAAVIQPTDLEQEEVGIPQWERRHRLVGAHALAHAGNDSWRWSLRN